VTVFGESLCVSNTDARQKHVKYYYITLLYSYTENGKYLIADQLAYRRAIAVNTIIIMETQQKDTTIKRFPVIIHAQCKRE